MGSRASFQTLSWSEPGKPSCVQSCCAVVGTKGASATAERLEDPRRHVERRRAAVGVRLERLPGLALLEELVAGGADLEDELGGAADAVAIELARHVVESSERLGERDVLGVAEGGLLLGDRPAELVVHELQDARGEVADVPEELGVHLCLEVLPRELGVLRLGGAARDRPDGARPPVSGENPS